MRQQDKSYITLTRCLAALLYFGIGIHVVGLVSGVMQYQLLSDYALGVYTSELEVTTSAESNDLREQIVAIAQIFLYVLTVIVFCFWLHRSVKNVLALGAKDMEYTPAWTVGSFFIPVLNLWRPYKAVAQLWQASSEIVFWHGEPRGSLLTWWWAAYLLSNFVGQIAERLLARAVEIDALMTATVISVSYDVLRIAACILALMLVAKIYTMQVAQMQRKSEMDLEESDLEPVVA